VIIRRPKIWRNEEAEEEEDTEPPVVELTDEEKKMTYVYLRILAAIGVFRGILPTMQCM